MKASSVNINRSIQAISIYLIHCISEADQCSEETALKKMLKTETYDLLQDRDSELYAESPAYVWKLMQAERNGDWEEWLKE